MTVCPECSSKLVWRHKVHVCLACHRRYGLDDSEIHCPSCTRCGGRTRPGGSRANRQRYRCLSCGYQSCMDGSSICVKNETREKCAACGMPLIKKGFDRGRQMWWCKACNRQSSNVVDETVKKKPKPVVDGNGRMHGSHQFFYGYNVIGYEPPEYCSRKIPCSKCKNLLRCGSGQAQLPCEGVYLVQTKDKVMVL